VNQCIITKKTINILWWCINYKCSTEVNNNILIYFQKALELHFTIIEKWLMYYISSSSWLFSRWIIIIHYIFPVIFLDDCPQYRSMWNIFFSPPRVRLNRSFFLFLRPQNKCFRLRDRYLLAITDERITISTRRRIKSCCERSIVVTEVTESSSGRTGG